MDKKVKKKSHVLNSGFKLSGAVVRGEKADGRSERVEIARATACFRRGGVGEVQRSIIPYGLAV